MGRTSELIESIKEQFEIACHANIALREEINLMEELRALSRRAIRESRDILSRVDRLNCPPPPPGGLISN